MKKIKLNCQDRDDPSLVPRLTSTLAVHRRRSGDPDSCVSIVCRGIASRLNTLDSSTFGHVVNFRLLGLNQRRVSNRARSPLELRCTRRQYIALAIVDLDLGTILFIRTIITVVDAITSPSLIQASGTISTCKLM